MMPAAMVSAMVPAASAMMPATSAGRRSAMAATGAWTGEERACEGEGSEKRDEEFPVVHTTPGFLLCVRAQDRLASTSGKACGGTEPDSRPKKNTKTVARRDIDLRGNGGRDWTRTSDPYRVKVVL